MSVQSEENKKSTHIMGINHEAIRLSAAKSSAMLHAHGFTDNKYEEWVNNIPNRVKLTRKKVKEECFQLGLKANKHNINDINSSGIYAAWTGPWLRLDEDKEYGKMWLSTFDMDAAHNKKHSEETLEEYTERVLPLTRGWVIKEGIKGSDNDEFPSRSIDITFCPPDEFIRIVRQFMP